MTRQTLKYAFCLAVAGSAAMAEPKTFASPEEAVAGLVAALEAEDRPTVVSIFGEENLDVVSTGDAVEDREIWGDFLEGARALTRVDMVSPDQATLFVHRHQKALPGQSHWVDAHLADQGADGGLVGGGEPPRGPRP